jgi:ATP-dependent Clp protease adaptor protein ClpS
MTTDKDYEIIENPVLEKEVDQTRGRELLLYNDDFNTFDFVIESLVEICNHDLLQAEQCAHIIHHNGKCAVKTGTYIKLNPMRIALCDRGLSAVIN